ncbi:MAG: carboxy terminal-processing peptidase [Lentisphaeria bacterium]|jgi:carboxyl-terminal processing protease|nr:carboxy terminal-processing peptidase [Lentisphaeria bacterium]
MAIWRKIHALALTALLTATLLAARDDETIESVAQKIRDTTIVIPPSRPFLIDLSREVANLTRTYHYSRRGIDRAMSQEWFDQYFDLIDRNRNFLLQTDIDDFKSARDVLGSQVYRQGRIDFAFDVYERLLQRIKQWAVYAADHVNDEFDFTVDEEIPTNPDKQPRAQTMAELEEIWRKQLKNSLLVLEIERLEREAKQAEETEKPGEEGVEKPIIEPEADPRLVVLKRYERYLARRLEVEAIEIVEMFLASLTQIYDPHSAYMAPATSEDFNIDMRLSLTGIGARLTSDDGYVTITEILTGGPAERDGRLKPDDRIVAVAQEGENPEDVVDKPLNKVVQKIRGEKGTKVFLTVVDKQTGVRTVIDIVRDVVKLEDQAAKSELREVDLPTETPARAKVAVIALPSFYRDFGAAAQGGDFSSSGNDIRRLIDEAGGANLDGLILDLRHNGGGSLDEAIAIAGLFFGEGPVVQVREIDDRTKTRFDQDPTVAYEGPLVVLVDKTSASASEIVAAALQDYRRAVIVGDSSTHGKGTVQQKMDLDATMQRNPEQRKSPYAGEKAGALKLTLAKYYRVTGGSTQLRGVVPDIILPSYTDHMELGEANIPHAMEWDEIQPARFACDVNVTPYLPELAKRSAERRANHPEFQRLAADIAHYAERRERKTVPLNLEARKKLIQEEKEWGKKLREARQASKNRRKPQTEKTDEEQEDDVLEQVEDLMLEEAIAVLGDLIALQRDPAFKAVAVAHGAGDLEHELQ